MTTSALPTRHPAHSIEGFFAARWSPRSYLATPISEEELMAIFEAARWAPSSYNNQPWRFLYALRETPEWSLFFDLLVDLNKAWAKDASALILVVSNTKFDHNGKDCPTHSFDAGSAWQNLALQAWIKGYITHGMQGFDYARAQKDLEVPPRLQGGSHDRPRQAGPEGGVAEGIAGTRSAQRTAAHRGKYNRR